MRPTTRRLAPLAALLTGVAVLATLSASNAATTSQPDRRAPAAQGPPGFAKVVFLSHVNDPATTPGFPGDPAFTLSTPFTVPKDGFYLQYVKEGEHTGTHWGAPCHFHTGALCADQLDPADLVRPAPGQRRLPAHRGRPHGVAGALRPDAGGRRRDRPDRL